MKKNNSNTKERRERQARRRKKKLFRGLIIGTEILVLALLIYVAINL
ncbi:MAG: hypothetical protein R3Y40_07740 [Eubacteriales bacterium]